MQQSEMAIKEHASELATPELSSRHIDITIVVPLMNEQESVRILFERIQAQINQLGKSYEIIFVDDGSTDKTFEVLKALHEENPGVVRVVRFRRNFGKTPGLVAGFERARGDVVFTMDGDLQDDPQEIPRYLEKLDEGYDLVTGWKFPRLDPISKTFPSRIFNGMVSQLTGVHLHDINCGFKAYRREVIEDPHLKLYGDFHRFIPVIAQSRGFRVAEIKVTHHPRQFGVSKFGAKRFAQGLIDLMNILFLTTFLRRPLRLFAPLGFWSFVLGVLIDLFIVLRSYFWIHEPIHQQPMLFVGILLMIFGVQFFLAGLQSEMIRHYAFQRDEEYSIRQELV
ncbi:glycosyltransferase family 2 protein [Dictyobacter aurantiacus]|uniref:Dolichol-phosphate mannosyltransferase n=1 Tax=Dictyobacter aurantiacus TaxID=1936993 RepID=A0A401Z9Z9_9CHLR|nr:glycosyltransferase family 2 protein [Dictyobacter aurantiacus]GCE03643.1 dolichol-phosphate mannosyltransferase [Dictyobacter aurantiacus]